jgi:hypothetical protein
MSKRSDYLLYNSHHGVGPFPLMAEYASKVPNVGNITRKLNLLLHQLNTNYDLPSERQISLCTIIVGISARLLICIDSMIQSWQYLNNNEEHLLWVTHCFKVLWGFSCILLTTASEVKALITLIYNRGNKDSEKFILPCSPKSEAKS